MSTICEVKFIDRESGVFFPGEVLRCNVLLKITKPKTLQEISILVTGKTKVRFRENHGKSSTTYRNELIYFNSKSILQKDPQADTFEVSVGTYSYNFEMELPNELPSSYQGEFGENIYEVKVILARAWRFDNEFVQPFTIIFPVDLNQNDEFKNPTSETGEKLSHLTCCSTEPKGIRIKVETPFSGYIPGQSIPVSLEISNLSRIDCIKIDVKLHRHALFLACTPNVRKKYGKIKLIKTELPGVPSMINKNFTIKLIVPPTPPTSPQIFDLIKIWYTITVEAFFGCCHKNLKMFVPMTIGTVPLPESVNRDIAIISSELPNAPLLRHMSSFEETQPEKKSFVDKDRDKFIKYGPFTPKYPVYNDP